VKWKTKFKVYLNLVLAKILSENRKLNTKYILFLSKIENVILLRIKILIFFKKTRNELNQIKQLFDELKDINEKIMNKYQANDTSKVKVKYDRLVSRFNDINNRY
jgi:F0F1-type ATP synthase gamma subunit